MYKKCLFIPVLLSLSIVSCSQKKTNNSSANNSITTSSIVTTSNVSTTTVATTETSNEVIKNEQEISQKFDTAIYSAFVKIIGYDSDKGYSLYDVNMNGKLDYSICDIDNNGILDLAMTYSIGNDNFPSCMIMVDSMKHNCYCDEGIYGDNTWRYLKNAKSDNKVLLYLGRGSMSNFFTKLYTYKDNEWILTSYLTGSANENDYDLKECILDGNAVEKDEFDEYFNTTTDLEETDDIFNVYIDNPIEETVSKFEKYFQNTYSINTTCYSNGKTGKYEYIIAISDFANNFNLKPFLKEQDFNEQNNTLSKALKNVKSTCFILDSTEKGTRIRCQNFDDDISFEYKDSKLISNIDGVECEVIISPEDCNINNTIISVNKPITKITKEEVGDLSNIQLNVTARVTANDGLVLREDASTESKQIDTIPYGANVNIISLKDNYYYGRYDDLMVKVDYNGKQGYVCSYFLLVDNEIDISKYSAEQKYAFGSLLYSQTDSLSSKFVLGTGLLECTYTNERFDNYVKLLPAGLTISQLSDDYYKYFSKNKPYDFNCYFLEKDGYLWKKTGFGLEPDGSYDEITEMVSASSNIIKYKATHFDNPVYSIREPEEHDFEICFEDNRWKVSDSFYYTNMPY